MRVAHSVKADCKRNTYISHAGLVGGTLHPRKPQFVPLRLPVGAQGGYVVELILATGRLLRVADGADPAWISRLVRELDGSC